MATRPRANPNPRAPGRRPGEQAEKGAKKPATRLLELDLIRIDGETQPRAAIQEATIAEYAADIHEGDHFPPLIVFHDGKDYWLAEGFHRWHAYRREGIRAVRSEVHRGTREEAQWHACGSNRTHGLRRTNEDKRRAVEMALGCGCAAGTDLRTIARHCGVSHEFVRRMRVSEDDLSRPRNNSRLSTVDKPIGPDGPETADSALEPGLFEGGGENETYDNSAELSESLFESSAEADGGSRAAAQPAGPATPPAGPRAPSPPTDEEGHELPPALAPDFNRRGEITRLMSMVSNLKTTLLEKKRSGDALYQDLNESAWEAECGNVRRHLASLQPHAVCPYCQARNRTCRACKGRGWLNKLMYDAAPGSLKGMKQ